MGLKLSPGSKGRGFLFNGYFINFNSEINIIIMKFKLYLLGLIVVCLACKPETSADKKLPNIVVIYVDDLGYADVGCYGAKGVETPNIDRIATAGIKFTDAHCSAATCTPSRFSLLTGSYAFRNNAAILPGDAPLLIRPGTPTLASMLKKAGYATGVVGKWHLGLGDGEVNWNEAIKPGPLEIGFDYSFLIPATGDRVPCVYVENHHVVGLDTNDPITVSYKKQVGDWPTGLSHPELLKVKADPQHSKTIVNGISRIGYMHGGEKALWIDEDFPDVLDAKAKSFIKENKEKPFFLYYAYHDIHVPRIPHPRFVGKSTMGPRGDAIAQMDWCTGEIINYLEELGIAENTLIIFSSDNGPVLDDGYYDDAEELVGDHNPSGPFRGGKYSSYEAGTRVPTIAYWPGTIQPGESKALWSHTDIFASIAKLTGVELTEKDAPDSYDMLDVILGKSEQGRTTMIEEGFTMSIRQNEWKYIKPLEGKIPGWMKNKKSIESGLMNIDQLYNLSDDLGEQNNIAPENTEKTEELKALLKEIMEKGYSREM